jgi:uncharacterized repeat protein (TIGR01451 family)
LPGTTGATNPQVQWVGSGWALVWLANADRHLHYALLDAAGALLVPATQVTFTSTPPQLHRLLWNGQELALAWHELRDLDPPGRDVYFTVLGLDGFKAFPEIAVASSQNGDSNPALYWQDGRFHLVHRWGLGGVREVELLADGTVVGDRLLSVRNAIPDAAGNGLTAGVLLQSGDMLFETTACLADATPPTAPSLSGSFDGQRVDLSWTAAADAESGVLSYRLLRDGALLAELFGTTASFSDGGFTPGVAHTYELRAMNAAFLESAASGLVVLAELQADLSVALSDTPDPVIAGQPLTYDLVVTNQGPDGATGVELVVSLPPEVAFVAAAPGAPACVHSGQPLGGTVTCTLGAIAASAMVPVEITVGVDPSAGSAIAATATATADQLDPDIADNDAGEATTVQPAGPGPIFSDGFESGDTSAWSGAVP